MRLTVGVGPAENETLVVLEVSPTASVRALLRALRAPAPHVRQTVWVERTGSELVASDEPVAAQDLRHGDRLLTARPATTAPVELQLVVDTGPDAGLIHGLRRGSTVVGRAADADVSLADPEVSRRHLQLDVAEGAARASDLGTRNGSWQGKRRLGPEPVPMTFDEPLELGDATSLLVLAGMDTPQRRPHDGRVLHNRPPRILPGRPTFSPEMKAPPEAPRPQRLPMVTALLPLAAALVLYVLTQQAAVLAMAGLAPVMAVGSWWESRRTRRHDFSTSRSRYLEAVDAAAGQWDDAAGAEARWRLLTHPGPGRLVARALREESELWERRPSDEDFLSLRVGRTVLVAQPEPQIPLGGDEALRSEARTRLAGRGTAPGPATVALPEVGTLGVTGRQRRPCLQWLVAQIAVMHSPAEVRIVVVTQDPDGWDWVRWLPHCGGDVPAVVHDGATARECLETLSSLVAGRAAMRQGQGRAASAAPSHVLVIDEPGVAPSALLNELLSQGPSHGVFALASAERLSALPGAARAVLNGDTGELQQPGRQSTGIVLDLLGSRWLSAIARRLAGMVDAGARDAAGELPQSLTLSDLLGTDATEPQGLAARWAVSHPGVSAAIGMTAAGALTIELRGDTSHALVGGTTGSGKSELLQTLVASLAVDHSPQDVTFLLVDYKGGAAFKDCVDLPHVVGFVTDLDGLLVRRALISLRAEVQRRQRILKAAGAQSLDDLVRRGTPASERPAYLLLVVDEFATLVKELPDFVDGVVDIAQRGRSLGVHLVLATQRPAGSINDAIRTNVPVRIALRLNDVSDSDDVIGSPVAARIPRGMPGRGYIRRSHSELESFQAAYAGAVTHAATADVTAIRVSRPDERPTAVAAPPQTQTRTDLQRVVEAALTAFELSGAPPPSRPWLEPLPPVLPAEDLPRGRSGTVAFGLVDEPAQQAQEPLVLDLERDGSLVVVGAPGSGTSTALRTIAAQAAAHHPCSDLWLYGIDCGTRALQPLRDLPHTGAVLPCADQDRIVRLFARLRDAIDTRRESFAETGAGSLSEHVAAGGRNQPRVLLLLDDLGGFRAAFERVENGRLLDELPRLVVDGRATGIHFVISADRRAAVPSALLQVLAARIVLRLSEPDDYAMLGLDGRLAASAVLRPGAGFVGGTRSVQIAVLGDEHSGDAQAEAVKQLALTLTVRDAAVPSGARPPGVGRLEAVIPRPDTAPDATSELTSQVGVSGDSLGPLPVTRGDGHLLIAGASRSGRSTTLCAWAAGATGPGDLQRWVVAPRRSGAVPAACWDRVVPVDEVAVAVAQLLELAPSTSILLAVDDADGLADTPAEAVLVDLLAQDRAGLWVAATADSASARRAYRGLLAELRKERHALVLAPDPALDAELLGAGLPRRPSGPVPPGRGVVSRAGLLEVVQVYAPPEVSSRA